MFRSQMIGDKVRAAIRGERKMTLAQLVQAMEEPATQDLRGYRLLPMLLQGDRQAEIGELREALATLRAWHAHGAHRRDLDRDGVYEENGAVELMDAWWPKLVEARVQARRSAPGPTSELEGMLRMGDHTGGSPNAPDFFDGWWSYVSKDLRDLFGPKPKGAWSRVYCGGGSKKRCRAMLRRTLRRGAEGDSAAALRRRRRRLCPDPQPSCFDQNRPAVTGGIALPPFPFQNRPTFQQVVTPTQRLLR